MANVLIEKRIEKQINSDSLNRAQLAKARLINKLSFKLNTKLSAKQIPKQNFQLNLASKQSGFSVIEIMVVVAIMAILALIAVPSGIERIIREQVSAAIPLAEAAKEPTAAQWKETKTFPIDNKEAGLPTPEKVVSNLIGALQVENGVIHMTFGNKARAQLQGKILTMRPAVIEESQAVPIAWVCGNAQAPANMTVFGENKTNIDAKFLPFACK